MLVPMITILTNMVSRNDQFAKEMADLVEIGEEIGYSVVKAAIGYYGGALIKDIAPRVGPFLWETFHAWAQQGPEDHL